MEICKALSDRTRFQMLRILLEEEREFCICEFEEFFDKDPSVLYRNMKKLEEAGLIETRKEGRKRLASVNDREAVQKLMDALEVLESDLPGRVVKTEKVCK